MNKIRPFWNGINSFKIHSFAFFVTPRRDYCKRLWTKSKPEEKSLEIPDFSYISGRFCQLITTFIRFVIPYSVINFVLSRATILLFRSNANSFYFLIQRKWTVTKLTELNLQLLLPQRGMWINPLKFPARKAEKSRFFSANLPNFENIYACVGSYIVIQIIEGLFCWNGIQFSSIISW